MPELSPTAAQVWKELEPLLAGAARDTVAAAARLNPGPHVQQASVTSFSQATGRADLIVDGPGGGSPVSAVDVASRPLQSGMRVWLAIWPPHAPLVIGRVGAESGGPRFGTVGVAAFDARNVLDWEFRCTGTDDQDVISQLPVFVDGSPDPGEIILSEGHFNFSTNCAFGGSGVTIRGQGAATIVTFLDDGGGFPRAFDLQDRCLLTDMSFVGPQGYCFAANLQAFSRLERCWLTDCGAYLASTGASVTGCTITGKMQYGAYMAANGQIANFNMLHDFDASDTAGFYLAGSYSVVTANTGDTLNAVPIVTDAGVGNYVAGNPFT